MKSTAIEVQKVKKIFRVFPYKFTRNNGEFVSYLDEQYLKTSMTNVVENELNTLINTPKDEYITCKIHDNSGISAVIRLEKYDNKVYGEDYIGTSSEKYVYACLEIVNKLTHDGKSKSLCKYVIPTNKVATESLLKVLDLNLSGCRLVSGKPLEFVKDELNDSN